MTTATKALAAYLRACKPTDDAVEAAEERLHAIAIRIGSFLLDGPDPDHGDEVELQAACVAYVESVRAMADADFEAVPLLDLSVKTKLIELDTVVR